MCREAEDYAQEEISGCKNFEEMEDYYQARRDSFIYSNIHTIGIFGHMLQKVAGGAFGNTMEVFTSRFEGPGDEALGEILSDFWQDCQVSVDIVNLLLDKGAEVNVRGGLNGTALRAAIAAKRLPVVKALIKRGSDINERWPIHGRVPLSTLELALRHRSSEAASFLMDQPTFDMEQCIQNTFALHEAARTSPIIVSRLLACGATVDRQNNSGDTPLHCAVREKNIESARRLIEAGADVNAMTYSHSPFDGKTTLEQSENFDHEEMFRLLIESGASATSQTSALKAILMEFRQKFAYKRIKTTQKSIIGLLIEGMADINAGIDWSAREGTPEFIHSFASYRPFFILLMLTQPEDLDVYRLFLDSPNFRFSDQSTNFLWCAARENLLGVVQLLLDYGAIPTHEMAQDIENHALRRQCFSFSPTLTEEEQRDRSLEHRSKIIQLLK
jgi:ankyrin repeat protein